MMKNKFYFLYVLSVLLIASVQAQEKKVDEYTIEEHASLILKEFNIVICKEPAQFINALKPPKMAEYFYIRQDEVYTYYPVFQSIDKECIVMYGIPWRYGEKEREMAKMAFHFNQILHGGDSVREFKDYSNNRIPRGQIRRELKAAFQIPSEHMDSLFHFDEHVTIVSGKTARDMFNADSLFFYEIPLDVPYKDVYNHCLGMISARKDMANMFFKWFFTDEGKKRQNDYIALLNKAVWYNDEKEE